MPFPKQKIFNTTGICIKINKIKEKDLDNIYKLVANGIPYNIVGKLYGINPKIFYDWMNFGERYTEEPKHLRNPKHRICAIFNTRIKKARAQFLARTIDYVNNTEPHNKEWNKHFRILTCRDPYNWERGATLCGSYMDDVGNPDDTYL